MPPVSNQTPEHWTIDLKKQVAVHATGLAVFMTSEGNRCKARRSNADSWVKEGGYGSRAPLVSAMIASGVYAYEKVFKKSKAAARRQLMEGAKTDAAAGK